MLSRYSPEQAALFKLISATDWDDEDPVINPFTTKLIEDKDLNKAVDTIASETRRWTGQVSSRQLASFLSGGFAAPDITKSPGGFTAFMFRPKSAEMARNPEEERNAIRSMFGDAKLDEASIKFYSKKDFYLAGNLPELEEQLHTTIKFLNLLTYEGGIASEGYTFGLRFLSENRPVFLQVIEKSPLFCTEFIYHLDSVFQTFLYKLGRHYQAPNPIREARNELRRYQVKSIYGTMKGFEFGSIPNLTLPSSLTVGASSAPKRAGTRASAAASSPKEKQANRAKAQGLPWFTKNPCPETAWLLPEGKTYGDYFNTNEESLRANVRSWPRLKHHSSNAMKPICIKYQCVGSCRERCDMAHIPPDKMENSIKQANSKRFAEVYAS
jgi:hypothetical protein